MIAGQSLTLDPIEKIVASATLSLLGLLLFDWTMYVCTMPVMIVLANPTSRA